MAIIGVITMPNKKFTISPKKYHGDTSVVSARLPVDMIRDIDRIAGETGRNRNEIIMLCLEYALDNLEVGTNDKEE